MFTNTVYLTLTLRTYTTSSMYVVYQIYEGPKTYGKDTTTVNIAEVSNEFYISSVPSNCLQLNWTIAHVMGSTCIRTDFISVMYGTFTWQGWQ